MHYSSGSTADKVTDPDKTKLVQAETSFVLSLSWWHKLVFNMDFKEMHSRHYFKYSKFLILLQFYVFIKIELQI